MSCTLDAAVALSRRTKTALLGACLCRLNLATPSCRFPANLQPFLTLPPTPTDDRHVPSPSQPPPFQKRPAQLIHIIITIVIIVSCVRFTIIVLLSGRRHLADDGASVACPTDTACLHHFPLLPSAPATTCPGSSPANLPGAVAADRPQNTTRPCCEVPSRTSLGGRAAQRSPRAPGNVYGHFPPTPLPLPLPLLVRPLLTLDSSSASCDRRSSRSWSWPARSTTHTTTARRHQASAGSQPCPSRSPPWLR